MANKDIITKEKTISAKKARKKLKRHETILIIAVVTLLVIIDAALVIAVLKRDNHDHNDHNETPTEAVTEHKYPEYSDEKAETEGAYYDTSKTGAGTAVDMSKVEKEIDAYEYDDFVESSKQTDFVTVRIKDYGDIIIALREDIAPKTVANFKKLVASGFYKDTVIHRVKKDVVIQGGIQGTDGKEKSTDSIYGEFTQNGFQNNLLNIKGVVSMGRKGDRDSATSSFMIIDGNITDYDGLYAAFGYVVAGRDVADKIADCKVTKDSRTGEETAPATNIVILDAFFVEPKKSVGIGSTTEASKSYHNYKISFKDENGNAISGISFKMTDKASGQTVTYAISSTDGKSSFYAPNADYELVIVKAEGYACEESYELASGTNKYTVTLKKSA